MVKSFPSFYAVCAAFLRLLRFSSSRKISGQLLLDVEKQFRSLTSVLKFIYGICKPVRFKNGVYCSNDRAENVSATFYGLFVLLTSTIFA